MSKNQNKSEIIPYQTFLKRLVIILTSVMVAGFLFLIIFIGYTAINIKKSSELEKKFSKNKIFIPLEGEIRSVSLNGNNLLILVQTKKNISKVLQISLATGLIEKEIDLEFNK